MLRAAHLAHAHLSGHLRLFQQHHMALQQDGTSSVMRDLAPAHSTAFDLTPRATSWQVNAALAARALSGQKRGAEPEPDADGAPVGLCIQ